MIGKTTINDPETWSVVLGKHREQEEGHKHEVREEI